MDFKIKKTQLIPLAWLFFLTSLVISLKEDKLSFFLGLLFSCLYMAFFFYSLKALFFKKRKKSAFVFLFTKWFFLLGVLILVSNHLSPISFLIGMGIIPALILSYFLEPTLEIYKKTT